MPQPWIHKVKTDSLFILLPSFAVTAVAILFNGWLGRIEGHYPFYTWLFLIVFVDVAHVYATLFKTYFVGAAFRKRKKLFILLPILCFVIGLVLFSFGSAVFWTVLAYIAVFHFIRQQFGFMRLYARNEPKTKVNRMLDSLFIYIAAGYPMLFWFFSGPRKFNWFMEHEFFMYQSPYLLDVLEYAYFAIMAFYVIRTLILSINSRSFNIPKNAIIIGTALSWYVGIVYFNNDLVFTLLNVVSHGIPYMALVYFREIEGKRKEAGVKDRYATQWKSLFTYIGIILAIAFTEEYLWDILVWKEHFDFSGPDLSGWAVLFVPLLTVPQFTHYLLDGFIWKSKAS